MNDSQSPKFRKLGRRVYLGRGVSISEIDGVYSIGVGDASFAVPFDRMTAAQAAQVEAALIAALEGRPSPISAAFGAHGLTIGGVLTIKRQPRPLDWLRRLLGVDQRTLMVKSVSASEITFDDGSSLLIPSANQRERPYRFWPVRRVKRDATK